VFQKKAVLGGQAGSRVRSGVVVFAVDFLPSSAGVLLGALGFFFKSQISAVFFFKFQCMHAMKSLIMYTMCTVGNPSQHVL
jgi:hypothetical protein